MDNLSHMIAQEVDLRPVLMHGLVLQQLHKPEPAGAKLARASPGSLLSQAKP